MLKIKILSIVTVSVFLSFIGAHSASAASCNLNFSPPLINAGASSNFSWNVSGSFTSAKLECTGVSNIDPTDVTGTVQAQPNGNIEWATTGTQHGSESCRMYFDGASSFACESNELDIKPVATCSLNFTPDNIKVGEKSVLSWNVSGGFTSAILNCDLAGSSAVYDALTATPVGSIDWAPQGSGTEHCKLYLNDMSQQTPTCESNSLTSTFATPTTPNITCSFSPNTIKADGTASHLSMNATNVTELDVTATGILGSSTYKNVAHSGSLDYSFTNDSYVGTGSYIYTGYDSSGNQVATCTANLAVTSGSSPTNPSITCSFDPTTITAGGTTTVTYNATGVARLTMSGTGILQMQETDVSAMSGSGPMPVSSVGSGSMILKGYNSAGSVVANCTANLTVNSTTPTPAPTATVSVSASKTSITSSEISYITWTSQNASTMQAECTGLTSVPKGGIQTSSAAWQADAIASGAYVKPAGAPDGFPAAFPAGSSGPEVCTFYPYGSDGKLGTPQSVTITVTNSGTCECNGVFSGGNNGCSLGKTCDGCHCVICSANCACAANTCSGSTCPNGCGGTCAGTKTDGSCAASGCGSQGEQILGNSATLTLTSPNLCAAGGSVNNFQKWCGMYLWTCGSSSSWCRSYVQGICGSVSGTTVTSGSLTATSQNLCQNSTPSYFSNTGTAYTWKCGKDGCGDGRSETNGVVSCQATISGGTPGACGTAANNNYACNATQTSGTLCPSGTTCYLNAGSPPNICPANIAFSGNQLSWYCGTDQNCYASKPSNCSTFSCTGTVPSAAVKCPNSETSLTASSPWTNCGSTPQDCGDGSNKCIYYTPTNNQYSCTGILPTNAVKCSGSDTGLTANTPWKSVGTAANSCTGGKCEYYTGSSCNWSLTLGANPNSGQAPLTSTLTATTQQVAGGETYLYSNQSCGAGGPTPTNINGASFTCVYPTAGTYYPSITTKAQSTSCSNNATATVTVAASSFSCTGSIPTAGVKCPNSDLNLTANVVWTNVGSTLQDCGDGSVKCRYYTPVTSYSCTGTLPTGSTKCEGDDTGLTSSIAWQSVGTSASSCTTARKCEYYTSGTACDLTATMTAVPTTGSAPFKTDLSAFAQTSSVPLHCSNQDCGGGTVSNIINECKFSCTYNNNGTYTPKVHVTNPNCSKDPTASVIVTGGSPACAAATCIGNSCWDGTKYISGTKTQGCASGSAVANPATLTTPNTAYITWTSANASKMDFACAGPISTTRGGWYLNDAACKNSGAVKECTDKGYGMAFAANQTGTEICVFYPYNSSDGQIGTPFTVAITSNSSTNTNNGKCGTAAKTYSSTDTTWGTYTFCETGQVNPASPTFPATGNSTAWTCKGANGGADSGTCTATRTNSTPTIDTWSVRINADPVLGSAPLKVKINSGWTKLDDASVTVKVTKQDCGASGVSPTNNSYNNTLNDYFDCNYTAAGIYYPSITYQDNSKNDKTAVTKVEVTSAPITDACTWSASWTISPQKTNYAVGEEIKASLSVSGGSISDFVLSDLSCGASTDVKPRSISNTSFSCTYPKEGAFYMAATAKKNSGCAKNIQPYAVHVGGTTVDPNVCKPDNANCAKETCNKYYCWDGCAYLKGTGGCN